MKAEKRDKRYSVHCCKTTVRCRTVAAIFPEDEMQECNGYFRQAPRLSDEKFATAFANNPAAIAGKGLIARVGAGVLQEVRRNVRISFL
jgi:hypothetical protein